jgi:hypothetical protein
MSLFQVTSPHPDTGAPQLDWNKVLDLLIKLAGIGGIIAGVWAGKQASTNSVKIKSQQDFLELDRGSNYVANAVNAATQRKGLKK